MAKYTSIEALKRAVMDDMAKIFSGVAISTFNQVIIESPRDTGRFANNWNASINTPDYSVSADVGTARTANNIGTANLNDVLYLTNNLPYAERLANGWSGQRPSGWIDTILIRARNELAKKIQGL